jgi:flagellar hook-basal body complex protein FliE
MSVPTLTITPSGAANAYARVQNGGFENAGDNGGFSAALSGALDRMVSAGHEADTQAARAISGQGNLTEVATAVSRAELSLQTAVAVRDKVVQAYQDVMRMAI